MKTYVKGLFSTNKFVKVWLFLVLVVAIFCTFKFSGGSKFFSENGGVITSDTSFPTSIGGLGKALKLVTIILVPSILVSIIPTYIISSIWIFLSSGVIMIFNFSVLLYIILFSVPNFNNVMSAIMQAVNSLVTLYFVLIIFKLVALISDEFMDNIRYRSYGNFFSNWIHAILKVVYSQRAEIVLSTVAVFLINSYWIAS